MSRHALNGIGQVIKANTTEKSIDDLRAEGKKRVRVVSSERVMTIIQAIVDDTINSEVGEITKRDRDRIVGETKERFSSVLKMQQDLEQDLDDLRGQLRDAQLERDRLRGEKSLLEAQLETSRRADGETDSVAQLARELARVREAVERSSRDVGADEAAAARVVEKIAARDAQNARRLATELEDVRSRLDAVARDAAATRETAAEKLVQRLTVRQCESDAHLEERLNRGFKEVADHVAELRGQVGRAPAVDEAVARLRADFDAVAKRIHGVESSSAEMAKRVATAVLNGLDERDAVEVGRKAAASAEDATLVAETLRRVQRSSEEARQSVLVEIASLRESVDVARAQAVGVQAEQARGLEERVAARAAESADAVAQAIERIAERVASFDGSMHALRSDVADAVTRAVCAGATASQSEVATRLAESLAEMRGEFAAMNARAVAADESRRAEVAALRDLVAQSAAVQSGAIETTFKSAMEQAIDKIERTMQRATARPIETTGEATDVLLSKMFDVPDGEMTSNLDELDVEERRSNAKIAGSVGRLKEMNGRKPAPK